MDMFLPEGFEPGLSRGRMGRPSRGAQLCVLAAGVHYPLLRRWATGFAVSASDVPALEGVVDLYDGAEHLAQCLITACEKLDGEYIFTIKRTSGLNYALMGEGEDGVTARLSRL